MDEKKAFIFDTNFIIQNQQLDEVIDNLDESYSVYVTQVSIDERIAQICRELKKQYAEVERCQQEYAHFVTVKLKKTYDEECDYYQKGIQTKYEKLFADRIIPLEKSEGLLDVVLNRANRKLPPFSDAKDASDKGFKDCLLWLSVVNYFKSFGENEVVFVTDDKSAFRGKESFLCDEFKKETGKTIVFKSNSFYREILSSHDSPPAEPETVPLPRDLNSIRDEIAVVMEDLRGVEYENYYGDSQWDRTFTTSILFDKDYLRIVFEGLRADIDKHIFEKSVPASEILDLDGRIKDDEAAIPIEKLEAALKIYQEVIKKYPGYCDQFLEATARILNKNYVSPPVDIDEGELPF